MSNHYDELVQTKLKEYEEAVVYAAKSKTEDLRNYLKNNNYKFDVEEDKELETTINLRFENASKSVQIYHSIDFHEPNFYVVDIFENDSSINISEHYSDLDDIVERIKQLGVTK